MGAVDGGGGLGNSVRTVVKRRQGIARFTDGWRPVSEEGKSESKQFMDEVHENR